MKTEMTSYRELKALNQSFLKRLEHGVSGYHAYLKEQQQEDKFKPNQAFKIGNLVDWALTGEEGKYIFVEDLPKSTTMEYKFMVGYINEVVKNPLEFLTTRENTAKKVYESVGFKKKSFEQVMSEADWATIYKIMGNHKSLIITRKDKDLADRIVNSFKTHKHTERIFKLEHEYQVAIVWDYYGEACKGLLDMVEFNHTERWIQPRDIKTTGKSTIHFREAVRQFRYDIQAAWYIMGLKANYPDYEIKDFQFIVESTKWQGCPLVYTIPHEALTKAYDDIQRLVELYKWHEANSWDFDREVLMSNGHIILDDLWQDKTKP